MELADQRILILGLGQSGLSMARYLADAGAIVSAADTRANPPGLAEFQALCPQAVTHCGPLDENVFAQSDAVAVSPGVPVAGPQTDPAVIAARARGLPFFGDIELFAHALAQAEASNGYRPRVLAITGTNGKTTVTSLAAHLASRTGKRAVAAGNIGPAVLDAWRDAVAAEALPDVWVLELSSFQLETTSSLKADAATVLNLTEDHLDRHGTLDAYGAAKVRIFANGAIQVLNRDDARVLAMRKAFVPRNRRDVAPVVFTFGTDSPAHATDFGLVRDTRPGGMMWLAQGNSEETGEETAAARRLMPQDALKIRGAHNAANALAALALCSAIGLPLAPMLKALTDYAGLPHRVQSVAEIGGVTYVDDSKGTNVGATIAALQGLGAVLPQGGRIVLIAGGEGKGQDFAPLADPAARFCRAVMLIGRDASIIRDALGGRVTAVDCASLEEAVRIAAERCVSGDTVLLSPACASYDMFRDYGHRAEMFVAAVRELVRPHAAAPGVDGDTEVPAREEDGDA
jgi:UDP-N-acetylmuramoylalanine--D-glutamate ligase